MTGTRGLVLGKFMPPHAGHLHLIAVARALCDALVVLVGSQPGEPLDGDVRLAWMRACAPGCDVRHLHRTMPQQPDAHPRFWELWRQAITDTVGRVDRVFAGEAYGAALAEVLGAEFVALPRDGGLGISGSAVREDPHTHWALLPAPVRQHYARRIRVVGPESAGKTTLSRTLAAALDATGVAEFARGYLEARGGQVTLADMPVIARGQAASEDALAAGPRPTLVCDTDPRLTAIWSQVLFGTVPDAVTEAGDRSYAATLLLAPKDVWQEDLVRYQPSAAKRRRFFDRCRDVYPDAVVLDGPWDSLLPAALEALEAP